jgi:hypothetical protein
LQASVCRWRTVIERQHSSSIDSFAVVTHNVPTSWYGVKFLAFSRFSFSLKASFNAAYDLIKLKVDFMHYLSVCRIRLCIRQKADDNQQPVQPVSNRQTGSPDRAARLSGMHGGKLDPQNAQMCIDSDQPYDQYARCGVIIGHRFLRSAPCPN